MSPSPMSTLPHPRQSSASFPFPLQRCHSGRMDPMRLQPVGDLTHSTVWTDRMADSQSIHKSRQQALSAPSSQPGKRYSNFVDHVEHVSASRLSVAARSYINTPSAEPLMPFCLSMRLVAVILLLPISLLRSFFLSFFPSCSRIFLFSCFK